MDKAAMENTHQDMGNDRLKIIRYLVCSPHFRPDGHLQERLCTESLRAIRSESSAGGIYY
jgi:hypothetical protein